MKYSLKSILLFAFMCAFFSTGSQAETTTKAPSVRDLIKRFGGGSTTAPDRVVLNVRDFNALKKVAIDSAKYEVLLGHDFSKLYERYPGHIDTPLLTYNHPWTVTGDEIRNGFFDDMARDGDVIVSVYRIMSAK